MRYFELSLPDDVIRKMTKAEYKAVRRWLRHVEWLVANELGVRK